MDGMDLNYLLLLQTIREAFGGVFDSYMLKITSFAETLPTFLFLAGIYWCVDKRMGQCMGWNTALACTWSQFLKAVCKIDRPWVRDGRIHPVEAAVPAASGYSFPSGHTARAVASWGVAGSCAWRKGKQDQKYAGALLWILTALILFSRNYLGGVHTPQDVIAALLLGLAWFFCIEKLLDWVTMHPNADVIACGAGCLLCFLPMLRVGCMPNAGAGMGLLLGWLIERRLVRFETDGSFVRRCVRFLAGSGLALFLLEVSRSVLGLKMEGKYAGFFSMFLFAFFVMAGYPYLFSRLEAAHNPGGQKYQKIGAGMLGIFLCVLLAFSAVGMLQVQNNVDGSSEQTQMMQIQNEQTQMMQVENEQMQEMNGKTDRKILRVAAHRGYSSIFPENTMAAFAGALDLGVDYIETDVQMTKDGRIVIFHDDELKRVTGCEGTVADYTYEELSAMDVGKWFSDDFAGERIPKLQQLLEMARDFDVKIYLELKDIGDVDGFVEAVYRVAKEAGMTERCVFASFRYEYLMQLKELDPECFVLYNVISGKVGLPQEFPADFYGLSAETANAQVIEAIHAQAGQVFVWTVDTPSQIKNVQAMGADGIVTNVPGLAKVLVHPEYTFLADRFERSVTMPGLYGQGLEKYEDMVVQGFTKTADRLVVSAYSFSGTVNSILWIMDLHGNLLDIIDLGFLAHTGGIAYDEEHDLLWVTGPEGKVFGISWTEILNGTYQGGIQVSFDAGLTNHNGAKVASFLTLYRGELYVGSYVDGAAGQLNRYGLEDVDSPVLRSTAEIPQRIQGVTFWEDVAAGQRYMLFSQGYQMEDACLMRFVYEQDTAAYYEPLESWLLPEGAEQILMTPEGLYVLFESSAGPYRNTARIRNDQIYVVRM